jgi:hypothetical protein
MLALHDLSFVDEGDEVIVGRVDTGFFVALPPDGAELLRRLSEGMTPPEAAAWYERTYAEPVDVSDFVTAIGELGFLRSAASDQTPAARLRFAGLARIVFSRMTAVCYVVLIGVWLRLLVNHPDLRPSPRQLFFTSSLVMVQIVITVGQIPLLFLHEGAHVLAGQRIGLTSRLNVSNRLTYVVFETELNGLLSVSRRRRYLPFLSGLLVDFAVLAAFGLAANLTRDGTGGLTLPGALLLSLGFTVLMRIAWQFQLYLRTDLYYVFSTALRCLDLQAASKALLLNRLWRRINRPERLVDEDQWTEHDRRVGRWYGPFLVVGVVTTVLIMVFGSAPIIGQYFASIFRHLGSGRFDGGFWDSMFSLGFNIGQLVLLYWLAKRKRRQDAARAPRLLIDRER